MQQVDAAIAGAGIIGLATALELASAGLRVVVFDRGHAMRECSWAAAGMLAATDPENPTSLRSLSQLSISIYPEFLARVEQLSGLRIPIRTTQTLQGTNVLPSNVYAVSDGTLQTLVPGLRSGGLTFFCLQEQSLDPRDIARALPQAARAAGVILIEQTTVTSIHPGSNSVEIQTTQGSWSAANFINACGAWASDLSSTAVNTLAHPLVVPRKGQILLVEYPEKFADRLTVVLRTPDLYLVPRDSRHIIIGATVEDAGYDKHVHSAVIAELHRAAQQWWPPIRQARIIDSWTGLRPATGDSLPVIGPAIGVNIENWVSDDQNHSWITSGHFRNGILLAPGTARVVRQMVLHEPLSIDIRPFLPGRFVPSFV